MIRTSRGWAPLALRRTRPYPRSSSLLAQSYSSSVIRRCASSLSPKPERPTGQRLPENPKTIPGPSWLWLEPIYGPFRAYGRVQQRRPYMTQFISSLVIYFVGDIVAQSISADAPKQTVHRQSEMVEEEAKTANLLTDRDWARTGRALLIGGLAAVPGYKWFLWLGESFNYKSKVLSLTTKVVVNQIVFTPIFNSYFFGMQSLLIGSTLPEIWERIQNTVPVSWVNSCKIWPAVTAFSFTFIPIHFRSIFGGVIAIGWQTYLSLLNQRAAKEEEAQHVNEDKGCTKRDERRLGEGEKATA